MNKTLNTLPELALKDLLFSERVSSWTHKELADFLIQEVWGDDSFNKFGTLKCAVLDRVINELFKLDDAKN